MTARNDQPARTKDFPAEPKKAWPLGSQAGRVSGPAGWPSSIADGIFPEVFNPFNFYWGKQPLYYFQVLSFVLTHF